MSEIRFYYFENIKTTTGYDTGLAKVAVQCSLPVAIQAGADTPACRQASVWLIKN
jgi:hypothetical protein